MKVVFIGGGTMGPVTPLLAVWEAWKTSDPTVEGVWIGTRQGPERAVVEAQGMPFFSLPTARAPRYISVEWLIFPFAFIGALWQAYRILGSQNPDLVASAGGYTAVPVILIANLLGINIWIHQQDVELIMTNKITIPFADRVTVAWEQNRNDLGDRVRLVGNPVRPSLLMGSKERAQEAFHLKRGKPTVLVFGGGSGSQWINEHIAQIAGRLAEQANVIHVTGKGKEQFDAQHPDYHVCEFLDVQMADVYAIADVVVCRAGLGTITELASMGKPAVMIPLPHSPQEANARMVQDACVVLDQAHTRADQLLEAITILLQDDERRRELGGKMSKKLRTHVADELVEMLKQL